MFRFLFALCLSVCALPAIAAERIHTDPRERAREAKNYPFKHVPLALGQQGMAATAHPAATETAQRVLAKGGTAMDAAIAAAWVLGVAEPTMTGGVLGADAFAIVYLNEHPTKPNLRKGLYGINASGRAPLNLTAEKVRAKYPGIKVLPMNTQETWTVPGAPAGLYRLHELGSLPMQDLLAPAINYAENGVRMGNVIAFDWMFPGWYDGIKNKPGFADVWLPDGKAPKTGELFRNPGLANAFRLLAKEGQDAFYKGEIAREIVKFSDENGGYFSMADFSRDDHAEWVPTYSTNYRGYDVHQLPPNGQGLGVLIMLNMLKAYDFKKLGWHPYHPDYIHTMIEAKKLVFEVLARYFGDPAMSRIPMERLLSQEFADELRAQIGPKARQIRDINIPEAARLEGSDTTYITVGDRFGNMVSLIVSPYFFFGSGYTIKRFGFPIQNRGALFSLNEQSPNFLRPGARPFHTIIPAMVMKEGKPWMSFGVIGGPIQVPGQVGILNGVIDFGYDVQQVGYLPRFVHSGSTGPEGKPANGSGVLFLEEDFSDALRANIQERGHVLINPETDPYFWQYTGGYQGVMRDIERGTYFGGSDPRKDGMALGVN